MRTLAAYALALIALTATPLAAQIALPGVPTQLPEVGGVVGDLRDKVGNTVEATRENIDRKAPRLLTLRERRLDRLLRRHPDLIERDARGELARRGEVLAVGLQEGDLRALGAAGFRPIGTEAIDGLDLTVTRLAVPEGMSLARAEQLATAIAPNAEVTADNLYLQSGSSDRGSALMVGPASLAAAASGTIEVGMIDGAPGSAIATVATRGFAKGAPYASNHGSAVASLLQSAGVARVRVADVYGRDPAGGNALAIAKGLGWLTASGSKVVTISLVGPRNAVVGRAIAQARRRGVVVVAAVGNDGPAAPPAYPASYDGVVAVTGVDGRKRALIEAGRALHLDYAAPGADIHARNAKGKWFKARGTSFATPLVAARIARAMARSGDWRRALDAEARDLGPKGPDSTYGRGLVCATCGRKK
ncbi:S8 family serine peptidase [Alteriqipengyuania sp.]|uniref:S8 family serine peptidase n=1 Tax=Alteriqipengyuania sp. TaxID=2800692 RepID=UPI003518643A